MSVDQPSERVHGIPDHAAHDATETGVDDQRPTRVDKALWGGAPQRVGRFEYHYDTDAWTWSDTVACIHGYQPGEVTPTTELVLSHKHPDDVEKVRALLAHPTAPFSGRHRIITTTGEERRVVVVGDAVSDQEGRVVATRGFYIDVTDSFDVDLQESVTERMDVVVTHRTVIDLAKGMLMAIYRIDADAAFELLKWRSQELNIKLFRIAQKVVAELPAVLNVDPAPTAAVDHYLMTLTRDED